jgi:hypothetical protein
VARNHRVEIEPGMLAKVAGHSSALPPLAYVSPGSSFTA